MANTLTLTLRSCKKKEEEEKKRIKNIQSDFVILYFFLKKAAMHETTISLLNKNNWNRCMSFFSISW